jgi:phosphatidylserine/phosphatidylglycerophosphate/cardiolipin synthase-like enzyme
VRKLARLHVICSTVSPSRRASPHQRPAVSLYRSLYSILVRAGSIIDPLWVHQLRLGDRSEDETKGLQVQRLKFASTRVHDVDMDQSSTRQLVNRRANDSLESGLFFDLDHVKDVSAELRSTSRPISLVTGTGFSIYRNSIIPAIKAARQEVILVTCFWAKSATLACINDALRSLSEKAQASSSTISVRICFSSSSLARNLLLPTPKKGQNYPPSTWNKFGLPHPDDLAGLNITITRKFFWPFGIIHSKYIIVDREVAIFPSCNVSWERWLEVAISLRGPIVGHLLSFHTEFWDNVKPLAAINASEANNETSSSRPQNPAADRPNETALFTNIRASTTLLPSPHTSSLLPNHLQPSSILGNLPCFPGASHNFPSTPLLNTTHHLLFTARSSIIMLTPNLTEPVVIDDLIQAMERGVDVHIWTNRTLMTMEQIVTAGTTTPRCLRILAKRSKALRGSLKTVFFDDGPGAQKVPEHAKEVTPIKLHAKVTIVDGEKILLGSGNMDAASWKTSQELGILVESRDVVQQFKSMWNYGTLG